jgi:hypothetical protein
MPNELPPSMTENARDKRVRKALKRHGYYLVKSKARNWREDDQKQFRIVEAATNWVAWGPKYELDLDTLEAICASLDARDGQADPAQLEKEAA